MSKDVLVKGAVKPWHVVFLFAVFLSVTLVASTKLTASIPGSIRPQAREVVCALIMAAFVVAVTAIVPEFRRVIPVLFARSVRPFKGSDFLLTVSLMISWTYGLYLAAFAWPMLMWNPAAFQSLHFAEALGAFEPKHIVFLLGSVVVAPVIEELVFRGYLLNLWRPRWGTWIAVLLSSLVFGLFHYERAVFAAPFGVILALVYLRFDSLWPGIVIHAAFNFAAFSWFLPRFFFVKPKTAIYDISSWAPSLILALLFVPLAFMFARRFWPARTAG